MILKEVDLDSKDMVMFIAAEAVKQHPRWWKDIIYAMDYGLGDALEAERDKVADLAYLGSILFQKKSNPLLQRYRHETQKGIKVIADFFHGATIEENILPYIEKETK
jgi:hypothetical protein